MLFTKSKREKKSKDKEVLQRMDIHGQRNCFKDFIKDHKENFQYNLSAQLANPAKNEVTSLSKFIIEEAISNEQKFKSETSK